MAGYLEENRTSNSHFYSIITTKIFEISGVGRIRWSHPLLPILSRLSCYHAQSLDYNGYSPRIFSRNLYKIFSENFKIMRELMELVSWLLTFAHLLYHRQKYRYMLSFKKILHGIQILLMWLVFQILTS